MGNAIDTFTNRRLAERGLRPRDAADRSVLIRRLSFDLRGLPPTPEEIERFVDDPRPDAYESLVDRFLASPSYGQRWGRHWLDVVRYADSNGADENKPYPSAYHYRNYVIDAWNSDRPYDEFIREQLAGDLLPKSRQIDVTNRRLVGTTFLALGIKIAAERDEEKKRADIIDEQIDTIGRAFLGLTVACARCHDHKFDPIPTTDYYAMAGVLRSTEFSDRPLLSAEKVALQEQIAALQARLVRTRRAADIRIASAARRNASEYLRRSVDVLRWWRRALSPEVQRALSPSAPQPFTSVATVADIRALEQRYVVREAESFERGNAGRDDSNYGAGIGIVSDKGGGTTWVEYDFELPESGLYQVEFRYAAANSRPGKLSINGSVVDEQSIGKTTGTWFPDSQKWFVEGRYAFRAGSNTLRFEVAPTMSHLDKIVVAQVARTTSTAPVPDPFLAARQDGLDPGVLGQWGRFLSRPADDIGPFHLWSEISDASPDDLEPLLAQWQQRRLPDWSDRLLRPAPKNLAQLADRFSELIEEVTGKSTSAEHLPVRRILEGARGPYAVGEHPLEEYTADEQVTLQRMRDELSRLEERSAAFKDVQVMSVTDGDVADQPVFVRGNHLQPGELVPRRFLTILSGRKQPPYPTANSGRLRLANSIASSSNALTARVIANRLWRWHFGRALVKSTENFGHSGAVPSHPQLLDHLAQKLIDFDWSIKRLNRYIVRSHTYRMSSAYDSAASRVDPENQWYWRYQPQRLEAELIRDALLRVAGQLDVSLGGAPTTGVRSQDPSPENLRENRAYYESNRRRSVYLPIVRTNVYQLLTLFDFPNPAAPAGNRSTTTIPTQALFLMNNPWMHDIAKQVAHRVKAKTADEAERFAYAFQLLLGRRPTSDELTAGRAVLAATDWESLCHTLLLSSEFIYVR